MTSSGACGIVVAHADLAGGLVRAVEAISGVTGALRAVTNDGLGAEALHRAVTEAARAGVPPAALARTDDAPGAGLIVFVDLAGGSCATACLRMLRNRPGAACITGANLPMLLDFVFHRDMPFDELVPRLIRKGQAGQRSHVTPSAAAE